MFSYLSVNRSVKSFDTASAEFMDSRADLIDE
jgi:hypothetical protein